MLRLYKRVQREKVVVPKRTKYSKIVTFNDNIPPLTLPRYELPSVFPQIPYNWKDALSVYKQSNDTPGIYVQDENYLAVYDRFPKSKVHLLVLTRHQVPNSISQMNKSHIPVLQGMKTFSQKIVTEYVSFCVVFSPNR